MKRIGYILLSFLLLLLVAAPVVAQDEGTTSALAGYTAGLNVGYPIVTGEYFKDGRSGPIIGVVGNTPYGFAVGPFNVGVGFGIESFLAEDAQFGVYGSLNSTIYVTPYGPLSLYGGAGYYGGLGIVAGGYYEYMVPNMPLVLKPYMRGTLMSSATEGSNKASYYINIGVMALYDISTLF
ncbi:MAG: hypothetical protein ABIA75_07415 [Candidatus Neomarinimicrobiota bacterium]